MKFDRGKVMASRILIVVAFVITTLLCPAWVQAQAENADAQASNPLAPFERLIGGQWHLEGSYQEFEWGVGRRSVKARSYFIVEDESRLVSEGIWFWHPEEKQIKGIFTAVGMPVEVFEYETRFKGNSLVSKLVAYSTEGARSEYLERWEFVDEMHFVWTLFVQSADGLVEEMGGTYSRK
jgi:hypothetical protein